MSYFGFLLSGVAVALAPLTLVELALRFRGEDVPNAIAPAAWIDSGLMLTWFILEFGARRVLVRQKGQRGRL